MTRSLPALMEFGALAVLTVAVPGIVALDREVFLHGSSEVSYTELTQEALILLSALLFGIGAWRQADARPWLVLVAGMFACMFIRELDMWLDRIRQGFWVYPATLTAAAAVWYAVRRRTALAPAMLAFVSSRSHAYITTGLLIVVLFSRVFGAGDFWQGLMAEQYHAAHKTVVQEGLELLGYVLIAFGSSVYYLQLKRGRSG